MRLGSHSFHHIACSRETKITETSPKEKETKQGLFLYLTGFSCFFFFPPSHYRVGFQWLLQIKKKKDTHENGIKYETRHLSTHSFYSCRKLIMITCIWSQWIVLVLHPRENGLRGEQKANQDPFQNAKMPQRTKCFLEVNLQMILALCLCTKIIVDNMKFKFKLHHR